MSRNVILTDVNEEQIFPITTSENVFVGEDVTLKETLDNLAGGGSAVVIDKAMSETSENPVQNKVISAKLNEVFRSVSNGKSLIASAITDRGVETDAEATFETMASNILAIYTRDNISPPNIFNHGDVVGLNPVYDFYGTNIDSNTTSKWTVTTEKISIPWTNNSNITFGTPMFFDGYKYLCFDCEITENEEYTFTTCTVGLRKASSGWPTVYTDATEAFRRAYLANFNTHTNYDGSTPWYELTRQTVKVPVDDITEACVLTLHACNCPVNIYGIWLE